MLMQEPEQGQPSRRQGREQNAAYPGYTGRYEPGQQQEPFEEMAADDYQAQKLAPQVGLSARGIALAILAIILSSLGFFLTVAGVVSSAIVLRYAHGEQALLAAGVIGLVSSILNMLVCIAFFVTAVVILAIRANRTRVRSWRGSWGWRMRSR
jgi:hypothetical protein